LEDGSFRITEVRLQSGRIHRYFARRTDPFDRVVDLLAIGSISASIKETILRQIPAPFSLAYLTAWLFNLLVVEIPKGEQAREVYASVAHDLDFLAKHGLDKCVRITEDQIPGSDTRHVVVEGISSAARVDLWRPHVAAADFLFDVCL
jgi:hypothetical protein